VPYETVAIDFDGVISQYDGWKGCGVFGELMPDVKEAIVALKNAGKKIIIYTTRGETEQIAEYLAKHCIPYDHINHNPQNFGHMNPGKPIADVYIDDRAICFTGRWTSDLVQQIIDFKPWYKKDDTGTLEELRRNAMDLANYSLMTCVLIDKDDWDKDGGVLGSFDKVMQQARDIFITKNKEYGNSFFGEGMGNAFKDIKRKYVRIVNLFKGLGVQQDD
jgi:hypothetical protein